MAAAAYFLTWACYGAWLPGQEGAIPRSRNQLGAPTPEADWQKQEQSKALMTREPYRLDAIHRTVVLKSMREACVWRAWALLAAHIRTNHVHVVVTATVKPEVVLTTLKAYSTRSLRAFDASAAQQSFWARHGSTRYLWTGDQVHSAIRYVVHEQGERLEYYEASP